MKKQKTGRLSHRKTRETLTAYLMLAPDLIGLIIFFFLPVGMTFFTSLFKWSAINPEKKFIGMENYKALLQDTQFRQSLVTTFLYALMYVAMIFCLSLLLALLVNSLPDKLEGVFRTLYFIPYAVSTVIAGIIWMFIFNPTRGLANDLLRLIGIPGQEFFGDAKLALFWIAFVSLWLQVGYYSIIFLAALKDVPKTYYEAAQLDGANAFTVFFKITFPLIREVSTFVLLVTTIASFQVFDLIKIITVGGPARATNVSVFYIYTHAFEYSDLGYSSAMAFILFIIIMIVSLFQLKSTKKESVS